MNLDRLSRCIREPERIPQQWAQSMEFLEPMRKRASAVARCFPIDQQHFVLGPDQRRSRTVRALQFAYRTGIYETIRRRSMAGFRKAGKGMDTDTDFKWRALKVELQKQAEVILNSSGEVVLVQSTVGFGVGTVIGLPGPNI